MRPVFFIDYNYTRLFGVRTSLLPLIDSVGIGGKSLFLPRLVRFYRPGMSDSLS